MIRDMDEVWKEYKARPRKKLREVLFNEYYPKVVVVHAEVISSKLPAHSLAGVDDLSQAGGLKLVELIDRFDLERKVKFPSFANLRVRGAMLDCLRGWNFVPPSYHSMNKRWNEARDEVILERGFDGLDEEVMRAKLSDLNDKEFARHRKHSSIINITRLSEAIDFMNSGAQEQYSGVINKDTVDYLFERLNSEERKILTLNYLEGNDMKKTSRKLKVSLSTAGATKRRAMDKIRAMLDRQRRDSSLIRN